MQRETRNLTQEECAQAVVLREEGWTYTRIAERFGVSHTSVSRMLQRFRETGMNVRRPGQGRPRVTTAIQERYLRVSSLRQRFATARLLQNQLEQTHGVQISTQTIRNRLREYDLRPRVAARGPALTPAHRRARLDFAREHIHWEEADWERVLFTDESRFCLYHCDRRSLVYRRPHERYARCNFLNTTGFGGGSIMVWGGISLTARTDLVVVDNGAMNADRYIRNILEEHVVPFAPYIGENFIFMDDNARPHRARIVQEYLEEVEVSRMEWPARSPDLNPIEQVWDNLNRRLRSSENHPATLNDLGIQLREIWEGLDQNILRSLILSMNRRCRAVINARGGNTKY